MRTAIMTLGIALLSATALFAQPARAYIGGEGGFATAPDGTSRDVLGEAGVRIAPNLLAFGDVGRIRNLQPSSLQDQVDATTSLLASSSGLSVSGTAQVPATYTLGGLRFEVPVRGRVLPYVFGGAGVARVSPTARFTYSNGPIDGITPTAGDDVTGTLVSSGEFTPPSATNAFMAAIGGGVEAPVAPHVMVDVGYRYARIALDTPVNTQSVTFGVGYRF